MRSPLLRALATIAGMSIPVTPSVAVLPGGRFACATHVGAYEQMSLTVHGLLAWCAERGQAVRGPVREVYVSDPAVTAPGELVTEVLVRLDDPARE